MAAPTRVSYNTPSGNYSTSTTPKTTSSFDVQAGDLITVIGSCEDSGSTLNTPTASGGSVTWTLRQSVVVANYSSIYVWTGAVGATATGITVTVTKSTGQAHWWGFSATVWRGHGGVGASNKANTSGAPSLSLTTTGANSAIQVGVNDWNAIDGTSRTWRSVNGPPATESLYFRDASHHTSYGGYHPDAGAAGSKTVGLSAPSGQKYSIVAVEVLPGAGGGTTYDVSGTVAATSGTSGDVTRLTRVLAVAGTVAALSTVSGDVARVQQVQQVSGTVAATSSTSGDVSRVGATQSVSGTIAAVSGSSGDVTRPTRTLAVSGAAAAVSGSSGDVSRVGSTPTVSGTVAAVSDTQGAVSAILAVTGTVAASSSSSGDVTRPPRTLTVSGTVAAVSGAGGSVSVVGGPQTYPVTGTVAAVSSSSGAAPTVRAAVAGTVAATSSTTGDVDVLRAPVVWQVAGTIPATSDTLGSVVLIAQASGTVEAVSGTSGNVTNPGASVDVRVLAVIDRSRAATITEHPRPLTMTEHPRQVTIRDRST